MMQSQINEPRVLQLPINSNFIVVSLANKIKVRISTFLLMLLQNGWALIDLL